MFVGQRINHKIFGEGEVINIVNKKSGYASSENIVIIEFDNPMLTEFDKIRRPDVHGVTQRQFTHESLAKFLV